MSSLPLSLCAGAFLYRKQTYFADEPTCSNGFDGIDGTNDRGTVCCTAGCGQCGGTGCGGIEGLDNTNCCINGVIDNQLSCDEAGSAPCVISGALPPLRLPNKKACPTIYTLFFLSACVCLKEQNAHTNKYCFYCVIVVTEIRRSGFDGRQTAA